VIADFFLSFPGRQSNSAPLDFSFR
jgi:hypothetical protein